MGRLIIRRLLGNLWNLRLPRQFADCLGNLRIRRLPGFPDCPEHIHGGWAAFRTDVIWGFYGNVYCLSLTLYSISVLVVALLYVAIGTAFMYVKKGARGKEALPNYEFWIGFPGLLKVRQLDLKTTVNVFHAILNTLL